MYGFFVLIPLTVASLIIGYLLASRPQVLDYVIYLTEIPTDPLERATRLQQQAAPSVRHWQLIAYHVISYAILCYAMITAARTISTPLPEDRPKGRFVQICLEAIFVAAPTLVLLWISLKAFGNEPANRIHWLAIVVLLLGLVATVTVTAMRRPLDLFRSSLRPFSITKTDALAIASILAIAGGVALFVLRPLPSSYSFGIFPVLMLSTSVLIFGLAGIFSRSSSPVAILSLALAVALLLQVSDRFLPSRDFRHSGISIDKTPAPKSVEGVKAKRQVPPLKLAFKQWLEHRGPAIEAYSKTGRAFPIFFATAQGGGMYAAYHPALTLARITDFCPAFPRHLFGISSVSGGSLGAAVYSEALRAHPTHKANASHDELAQCTLDHGYVLESSVNKFFNTDFLSPVIATAIVIDTPGFFIPPLRYAYDRAKALEDSFETAWQEVFKPGQGNNGLSANFYERWKPEERAPALFMSTTGVNFGLPVLISQIDWSHNPFASRSVKTPARSDKSPPAAAPIDKRFEKLETELRSPDEDPNAGVTNILDFRPDLQLTTSSAVVLSARFPFITPPGVITRNATIEVPDSGIFEKIKALELTDGGFYDNSGAFVAGDIVREMARLLEKDADFAVFSKKVRLHVIRFTDTPAKRQVEVSEGAHFELMTPLVAYDAVRLSRGVRLPRFFGTTTFDIQLLDDWYNGTLNWLLSQKTKDAVQLRSAWDQGSAKGDCCAVQGLGIERPKQRKLEPKDEEYLKQRGYSVDRIVPNKEKFEQIFALLKEGAEPTRSHLVRPSESPQ